MTERRMPEPDYREAAHHERQVRSMTRMMLPMMDVANLVERTPEADRRRAAEHERLARAMDGHAADMAKTSLGKLYLSVLAVISATIS
jgi:hypothetical protein